MEELVLIIGGKRKAVARLKKTADGATYSVSIMKYFDGDRFLIKNIENEEVGGEAKSTLSGRLKNFCAFSLFIGKGEDYSFGTSKGYTGDTSNPFESEIVVENEEEDSVDFESESDKTIETIEEEEFATHSEEEKGSDSETELGFEGEVASINYYEKEMSPARTPEEVLGFVRGEESGKIGATYYDEIKKSLDGLFANYPPDEYLNATIPSSKWVKIDYDGEGKSYSVGVLTDGDEVVYIGYGIRAHFSKTLPSSIKSVAQWVPLDFAFPKGEGYFMIYQKASDGSNV